MTMGSAVPLFHPRAMVPKINGRNIIKVSPSIGIDCRGREGVREKEFRFIQSVVHFYDVRWYPKKAYDVIVKIKEFPVSTSSPRTLRVPQKSL